MFVMASVIICPAPRLFFFCLIMFHSCHFFSQVQRFLFYFVTHLSSRFRSLPFLPLCVFPPVLIVCPALISFTCPLLVLHCSHLHTNQLLSCSQYFSPANQLPARSPASSPHSPHLSFSAHLSTCTSSSRQISLYLSLGFPFSSIFVGSLVLLCEVQFCLACTEP